MELEKLIDSYKKDFSNLEIYRQVSSSKKVQVTEGEVENLSIKEGVVHYVRAFKDGRVISFMSSGEDLTPINVFLNNSSELINKLPEDNDITFSRWAECGDTENLDIDDWQSFELSTEELKKRAVEMEQAALSYDKRITGVKQASYAVNRSVSGIANSLSPYKEYASTSASSVAYVIAEDGNEQDGYEFDLSVSVADLNHLETGQMAAERAVSLLGAKKLTSGKYHVIFDNSVMSEFLEIIFHLVSGENVYKKMSMFEGLLEKNIASKEFNLIDDALLKGKVGSYPFDDEGLNAGCTTIIKEGVLKSFLHNSYTAKKLKMNNTANAAKDGSGNIGVGHSNFILKPSENALNTKDLGRYIRVLEVMGMHMANPVSGEFSVGISGILYDNEEMISPFKESVLTGNIKDLLNGTLHVFDNTKDFGGIICGDVLFDKLSVGGE